MPALDKSEISRINGARSHGPKTAQGRERSSLNSLRHGLASRRLYVLSNETPEKWERLLDTWIARLQPADDAELDLVTEAAFARWRMRRLWVIETSLMDVEMDLQADTLEKKFEQFDEGVRQACAFKALTDDSRSLAVLTRYEPRLRRSFEKALAALETLRASAAGNTTNQKAPNEPGPPQLHQPERLA